MIEGYTGPLKLGAHQEKALQELSNGKVLWGGVGTGKSFTAAAYYMAKEAPRDVYVITTAKKRDSLDWESEFVHFGIGKKEGETVGGILTVDSWNNLGKYANVQDAFFIFDEQRVVGSGAWVKAFVKLARKNHWILLSATPGDTWVDYIPLFVANGFYRNRTQFIEEHVIYKPFQKFPVIDRFTGVGKLVRLRNQVLVEMPFNRHTTRHIELVAVDHDRDTLKEVIKTRWNPYTETPMKGAADLFATMRRVVNSDVSRLDAVRTLMSSYPRMIIFYSFDYELMMLRSLAHTWSEDDSSESDVSFAEWNGHKHEEIPNSDRWIYLVQYTAGAEGWNCVDTNAMVLFSMQYSYKTFEQVLGRIDRLNTPYHDLYYFVLQSASAIDRAIWRALQAKKSFNERDYIES